MAKRRAPVLDTEYLYPPVSPGQEPIILQPLPLAERIERMLAWKLENLEYERARADAAVAELESLKSQLTKLEMAYSSAVQSMDEWRTLCNQQLQRAQRADAAEAKLAAAIETAAAAALLAGKWEDKARELRTLRADTALASHNQAIVGNVVWMDTDEIIALRTRADAADAKLAARNTPCVWTRHKDHWNDVTWTHQHGNDWLDPDEFCQYCGSPIEQVISEGYE